MQLNKIKVTDTITYVAPDSTTRFTSCSGIMVNSKQTVWIDMNLGEKNVTQLLRENPPKAAAVTHYHMDHSVWMKFVAELPSVEIWISRLEKKNLTSLEHLIENTAGKFGMAEEWRKFVVQFLGYREMDNSFSFYGTNGESAEFMPEAVLLETPGHSPGHTSFYFPEDKILFSGDMGLDRFGSWYGWSECGLPDFIESILRLSGMDIRLILTSHGGIISSQIKKRWTQSLKVIGSREKVILEKLEAGISEEDIIEQGVFYKGKDKVDQPMQSFLTMWDTAMFLHHKDLLDKGGLPGLFPELNRLR